MFCEQLSAEPVWSSGPRFSSHFVSVTFQEQLICNSAKLSRCLYFFFRQIQSCVHVLSGWLWLLLRHPLKGWLDLGRGCKLSRRRHKRNLSWCRVGVGPFSAQRGTACVTRVSSTPSWTRPLSCLHLRGLKSFVYPLTCCQTITLRNNTCRRSDVWVEIVLSVGCVESSCPRCCYVAETIDWGLIFKDDSIDFIEANKVINQSS